MTIVGSHFSQGFAAGKVRCQECGELMKGWIALPPHEVEFCNDCDTWERAFEVLQECVERGRQALLS